MTDDIYIIEERIKNILAAYGITIISAPGKPPRSKDSFTASDGLRFTDVWGVERQILSFIRSHWLTE